MTSDVASLFESACRCPIGEYDLWDAGMRASGEAWQTYEDRAPAGGIVDVCKCTKAIRYIVFPRIVLTYCFRSVAVLDRMHFV